TWTSPIMNCSCLGSAVLLFCLLLGAHSSFALAGQAPQGFPFKHPYQPHEKELVSLRRFRSFRTFLCQFRNLELDELQEVLEKLQHKKVSTWEKKFNQVPKCSFGDLCAVRKGARIGKLCDCPRRSACNAFLLKCL
uniref:Cocaine- and amphetamine-regulated transcript protein n=1 Tax=Salvator merianae TaxID=96440 RepID=A0A8D0AZ05_SALMN